LDFDGGDDQITAASLPNNWDAMLDDGFTISFRVRPSQLGNAQRLFFIQQDLDNFATALLNLNGTVLFYVVRDGLLTSTSASEALSTGIWRDVAVRWQPGVDGTSVWLDGEIQPPLNGGPSSTGTNGVFTIGARTDGSQRLQGTLDEFRIWAEPLDAETIVAVSENICLNAAPPLLHDYQFEVGTPGGDNTGLTMNRPTR
jgi:hypothetical protein